MLEHRTEPLLTPREFILRQLWFTFLSAGIVAVSLAIGAVGYRGCEGVTWLDAVYDAAMILTGMGPAVQPHTDSGKIFVTIYALFSAMVFLTASGFLVAPLFHRVLHRLHLEDSDRDDDARDTRDDPTTKAQD